MKRIALFLFLFGIHLLSLSLKAQSTDSGDGLTLDTLREAYLLAAEKLLEPLNQLGDHYKGALNDLAGEYQSEGNLAAVLAVREEIKQVDEGTRADPADENTLSKLARLQSIYRKHADKLDEESITKFIPLTEKYETKLNELKVSLTRASRIDEAIEVQKEIDRLKISMQEANGKLVLSVPAENRFVMNFAHSRWWQESEIRSKPAGAEAVEAPAGSPAEIGSHVLQIIIPAGAKSASPIEIELQKIFGEPVHHAKLTFWMKYEKAPNHENFSLELPGFVTNSRSRGCDGTNHWCAYLLLSKANSAADLTRSYMGYTFHENIPPGQPFGSFVFKGNGVDILQWNRFTIEVSNNSLGAGDPESVPEDGVISVSANAYEIASVSGYRFRTIEDLPIKAATLELSRGESGPSDKMEEIPVLIGGVMIERLDGGPK